MKKVVLLLTVLIMANAQACFLNESKDDYEDAIFNSYAKFERSCDTGCFPVVPVCERSYLICFETKLQLLEKNSDCRQSSVLVEAATESCLRTIVPLSIDM